MPGRSPTNPIPDLFDNQATPPAERKGAPRTEIAPTDPSSSPRHLLPKDLPRALAQLDDGEIDTLLTAVTEEAKRRGRLAPPTIAATTAKSTEVYQHAENVPRARTQVKPAPQRPGEKPAGDTVPSLTIGQANAVRAAFMAGVKPSTIARQFGISQSVVRQALATEARGRKP
jgi:hypothetical protein